MTKLVGICHIRPAILEDAQSVLALRNHPESVFWSGQPCIPEEIHHEWFPQHYHSIIVLADIHGEVGGYARIDDTGRVSFAVHEELVGRGYGRQLLLALEPMARTNPNLSHLWAEIHPSNISSMRAFMHAGYSLSPSPPVHRHYERVQKAL